MVPIDENAQLGAFAERELSMVVEMEYGSSAHHCDLFVLVSVTGSQGARGKPIDSI
jgi:hypothetical protein